jgi:Flp pilus assembly protein CpaB
VASTVTILADGPANGPGPDSRAPRGSERTVARRPNVLNGRALVGALLVAVAAVVVFSAWLGSTGGSGHPVVIVNQPLAAGTTLSSGDLGTARVRLPAATSAHTFSNPSLLVGRILSAPLAPDELVQSSDLVATGQNPPLRPVAVTVDSSDASALAVGDLVDVLVTGGTTASSPTQVVLRGARVLSVANPTAALAGADTGTVVTVGVATLGQVTAVVHAERTGTLNVVVGEPGDGTGLSPDSSAPAVDAPGAGAPDAGTS